MECLLGQAQRYYIIPQAQTKDRKMKALEKIGLTKLGFPTFGLDRLASLKPADILNLDVNPLRLISRKAGDSPGTVAHVGRKKVEQVRISIVDYDAEKLETVEVADLNSIAAFREQPTVTWLTVAGLHDVATLKEVGESFGIHALTLEDIANTTHRPKMDTFDDYLFVVGKFLKFNNEAQRLEIEQLSLILGREFLLVAQEDNDNLFGGVLDRLTQSRGRIRKRGPDYLAYTLLDAIVDHYLVAVESFGDLMDDLQTRLLKQPDRAIQNEIFHLREQILWVSKAVAPMREIVRELINSESDLIQEETLPFMRDVHDHMMQVVDALDHFKESVNSLLELYHTTVSNQMNDIMKVLTIIATIFIPLSFIAGVYGTNFKYIPELEWNWGYFGMLGLMALTAGGMLVYFWRKRWF